VGLLVLRGFTWGGYHEKTPKETIQLYLKHSYNLHSGLKEFEALENPSLGFVAILWEWKHQARGLFFPSDLCVKRETALSKVRQLC